MNSHSKLNYMYLMNFSSISGQREKIKEISENHSRERQEEIEERQTILLGNESWGGKI